MLFEAFLGEHVSVVSDGLSVVVELFGIDWDGLFVVNTLDPVVSEKYTLAEEVSEDVVCADELQSPVQGVEDLNLHKGKLLICEWGLDVVQELRDAGVSLLVILGGDEDAGHSNQGEHISL